MNSRSKCQLIRHARGDIIEPFDSCMSVDERKKCALEIWKNLPLPSSAQMKSKNYFMKETKSCQNCGSKAHLLVDCRFDFKPCDYPHIGILPVLEHSAYMCPDLMAYCSLCCIRGHRQQEHQEHVVEETPLELRQRFKKFAHLGKYSSIPFLFRTPGFKDFHFRASVSATSLSRAQPDIWLYHGRFATIPEQAFEKTEAERIRVTKNLDSTKDTVVWFNGD